MSCFTETVFMENTIMILCKKTWKYTPNRCRRN